MTYRQPFEDMARRHCVKNFKAKRYMKLIR